MSSAAGSDSGMPSAHSRVRTRLPTPVPDHRRGAHVAVVRHDLAQLVGAGRLEAQVELQLQRAGHRLGEARRLQPPRRRGPALGDAGGQRAAPRRRAPPARSIPGRSTFTATWRPSSRRGRMRLGERGGRRSARRTRRTARSSGRPSAAVDLGPGDLGGERRQPVLQPRRGPRRIGRRRCRRGWRAAGRA